MAADGADRGDENPENRFVGKRGELVTRVLPAPILSVSDGRHSTFSDCTMTRAHVLRVLGASVASERRVVMAVLRGYRQALACAQPA